MKKNINLNKVGFSLVELLGIIFIISLVGSIAIYSVVSIINNSKEKSYKMVVDNVEKAAENYVVEKNTFWIDNGEGEYYYQCISVQNLIDMGYFKNDLLNSNISNNRKIVAEDRVLVKKTKDSKAIASSELLLDNTYDSWCNYVPEEELPENNVEGNIIFKVVSSERFSKDVEIKYSLSNVSNDMLSDYTYHYELLDKNKKESNNFTSSEEVVNITVNESVKIHAEIRNGSVVIFEDIYVVNIEGVGDIESPILKIEPFGNIVNMSNDKKITIKAIDEDSGLKLGDHTINYLFTTEEINSCNALIADSNVMSINMTVEKGEEHEDTVTISIPDYALKTPSDLNLYACSKNLSDQAGNLYQGIVKDSLKVYDLEKTTSTALFYLPSVLSCEEDTCSLGSGGNFLANGVSLKADTNFYYLWSQPMNLFKMYSSDWPFVGAYVALDDVKNLFQNAGDELYNEALNSAEVIFDDGTGTKYVFGYIPLENRMGATKTCLTTIPCN
ncbi:MAG: type II secretion system protein [Bacilli bacterium]|nr:type II secretion system protein [Bacilli bacterium]